MIFTSVLLLLEYSNIIREEAGNVAAYYTETTASHVQIGVSAFKNKVQSLANTVIEIAYNDSEDFRTTFARLGHSGEYGDISFMRYFKDGSEYIVTGEQFDLIDESPLVKQAIENRQLTCVGVVADKQYSISIAAFCVPVDSFEYADSFLICYPVDSVVSDSSKLADYDYSDSTMTAVCSAEGEIVKLLEAREDTDVQLHGDVFAFLRDNLNDKSIVDSIKKNIEKGTSENYFSKVAGEDYIVSVNCIYDSKLTPFFVLGYYKAADLYPSGYFIIRAVLGELMVFFIVTLIFGLYGVITAQRDKKKLVTMNDYHNLLDCPTRSHFERVASEYISKNKATSFAVIVTDINHYEYFANQIDDESMLGVLRHIMMVYSQSMQLEETFAYLENGRFVLLLHYRSREDLEKRISSISQLASHQIGQSGATFVYELMGGIYETNRYLTESVPKMIELAINVEKASGIPYDFGMFRFYNESMHASSIMNDYIETHMESALQKHDFKVFYQPKYNITEDRVDGCEALVRWYNPEKDEYMQPGVFLPLFEANRFIIKLDRYVYEQVLLYIEDAVLNGLPLVPVSVNVSRMTAIDPDFVTYYSNLKAEHGIADKFITIEFTESFAYEDYDMLRDIVKELHDNGFKCSIDDFGSGFSSYNILKELPMDEIKLDRFFISEGYSKDRDLTILKSIITLGRDLRMKVTQEGVEFGDQVELLRKLGCQVIQGYHYSKPLSLTDYIGFLTNNKKI